MPRLSLRGIHKRFGSTRALRGATLELEPGEVHALLGENGAGKSTLVRVLYGLVRADSGEVYVDGRRVRISGPRDALALGIGLVHQHFMGVPALSVAENLDLGAGPRGRLGREGAREVLAAHGLDLDPDAPAATLATAEQQRLEIVRALLRGARVLVLDEPTAVLAPSEVEALLGWLRRLREEGRTVLFISHKLAEITSVCDRVTVLRHGETVTTRPVAGLQAAELGRLMVGEAAGPAGQPPGLSPGPLALQLEAVHSDGLTDVDLEVRAGEIVALAGIDGNGQGPLERLLAGLVSARAGRVRVLRPPLALLSADRQRTGLVLDLSLEENLVLEEATPRHRSRVFRCGWLDREARREAARAAIEEMAIGGRPDAPARTLSGGNQQKLCVARALRANPGVLVAVNPTRGLDAAGAAAVRDALREQARRGAALLVISTDLDEVLELGDRIQVLFRGRLTPLAADQHAREAIGRLMLGEAAA